MAILLSWCKYFW